MLETQVQDQDGTQSWPLRYGKVTLLMPFGMTVPLENWAQCCRNGSLSQLVLRVPALLAMSNPAVGGCLMPSGIIRYSPWKLQDRNQSYKGVFAIPINR